MKAAAIGCGEVAPTASDSRPRPGILLDRDGTIIVDHGYVGSVDRVEFITGRPMRSPGSTGPVSRSRW